MRSPQGEDRKYLSTNLEIAILQLEQWRDLLFLGDLEHLTSNGRLTTLLTSSAASLNCTTCTALMVWILVVVKKLVGGHGIPGGQVEISQHKRIIYLCILHLVALTLIARFDRTVY